MSAMSRFEIRGPHAGGGVRLTLVRGEIMKKPFTTVTVVVLAVVAIAHALRLIFGLTVALGGAEVPMWVSTVALVVAAALAIGTWRENL
jgi:hypothetical protein